MKYSINEVAAIIENEGLGYAIESYCSPSSIRDEDLSNMWEEARDLLIRIQEYIDLNNGSDDSDEDDDE